MEAKAGEREAKREREKEIIFLDFLRNAHNDDVGGDESCHI